MDINLDTVPRWSGCVDLQVEPSQPLDEIINIYVQGNLVGTAKTNGCLGTHFVDNGVSKYRAPYILYYYGYRCLSPFSEKLESLDK